MSPQTPQYPGDPGELLVYLQKARESRRRIRVVAYTAVVMAVMAFVLVCVVIVNQHNSLVDGCQRAHQRDAEMARLQLHAGARMDREAALRRAGADCGALFSLWPF